MKYAICNETFHDRTLAAGLEYAKACGYTGIEIAPFTLATYATEITPSRRAEVRQLINDQGLEVVGLHWLLAKTEGFHLTTPDQTVQNRTAEYLIELTRLCRDLGGGIMVLGSPQQRNLAAGMNHEQGMDLAAQCLEKVLPTLAECQVTLAIEPLGPSEGNFLNTASAGVELIERLNSSWVGLHLDVKAMASEETPIAEIIRGNARYLKHFHANDPNKQGPGFGKVDFVPIIDALREIRYDGWVSVEVFDYTPGVERLARQSLEYLQKCARAGNASQP
ncbi:MAG: sugar phosphate isomerase/epimerase family protein [Pirellulales bacterium]|nr:sugar phosphate isomerase/epimerase family protein [Pirellulales bacterium]